MHFSLAIDIGTTSVKVLAFSPEGQLLAREERFYPILQEKPTWKEQDAESIFKAVLSGVGAVTRVCGSRPDAIGISAAMHSLLVVGSDGMPLGRLIPWVDQRSWPQAERLKSGAEGQVLYEITGTPVHPMSPLCKLIWLRENEPDRFRKGAHFVTIKSYVLFRLFNRFLIDYSDASATGLFDIRAFCWYSGALEAAAITEERLPMPVPAVFVLRGMAGGYAATMGLDPDTPVVIGASDGCLANLGSRVMEEGAVAVTIGTSGAIRVRRPAPLTDPEGRLFNYVLTEDHYISGGAVNNGAYLLEWFRRNFGNMDSTAELLEAAAKLPPGAGGLLCLPYLLGERAPVWDGRARGAFVGLTDAHTPLHLLRSMLEGLCFNIFHCGVILRQQGVKLEHIFASGGFSRSPFGVQLLADVFKLPVTVDESEDASARGAAILAMYALGITRELKTAGFARSSARYEPDEERSQTYSQLFELYQELYPKLKSIFVRLSAFH